MKIEKVNENQIRCTLTREDLASRELKISELAYGTEKAKTLFRDMMRQANFEFGFEAEDIPLMIEAIPLGAECIVLIVTKVEDPEELDTRFSRFAPSVTDEEDDMEEYRDVAEREVMDLFRRLQTDGAKAGEDPASKEVSPETEERLRTRIFQFGTLQEVMTVSSILSGHYAGASTLYKDGRSGRYLLLLTQGEDSREAFDRVCNIVSEYASLQRSMPGTSAFLAEHCEVLVQDNAVQALGFHSREQTLLVEQ